MIRFCAWNEHLTANRHKKLRKKKNPKHPYWGLNAGAVVKFGGVSCVVNAYFSFSTSDYCVPLSWLITDLECPAM